MVTRLGRNATGHVLGSLIQTLAAMAVLIGVAFGLGFRSAAGPLHWLAAIGVLALFAFALIWLAVALGLAAKSVETASNTPMILLLLLFLSSGFVATATMPTGLRQFAEYQPFTTVAHTVRGLLSGAAIGDHAIRHRLDHRHRRCLLPLGHPPLQPAPSSRAEVSGGRAGRTQGRDIFVFDDVCTTGYGAGTQPDSPGAIGHRGVSSCAGTH